MTMTTMWLKAGTGGLGVTLGIRVGDRFDMTVTEGSGVELGFGLGTTVFVTVERGGESSAVAGGLEPEQATLTNARMANAANKWSM
jgi:hypothetical protein